MLKIEGKFKFTRTATKDYHFEYAPENCIKALGSIKILQDYFGSLINDEGFYSFRASEFWVCAKIKKMEIKDQFGRHIFTIEGIIIPIKKLTDEWLGYFRRIGVTSLRRYEIFPGEYGASLNNLKTFYDNADLNKPLSWAWGVKPKVTEFKGNSLVFDYRFTDASNEIIRTKLIKPASTHRKNVNPYREQENIIEIPSPKVPLDEIILSETIKPKTKIKKESVKADIKIAYLPLISENDSQQYFLSHREVNMDINFKEVEENTSFFKYDEIPEYLFSIESVKGKSVLKNKTFNSLWITLKIQEFYKYEKDIVNGIIGFLQRKGTVPKSVCMIFLVDDNYKKKGLSKKKSFDKKKLLKDINIYETLVEEKFKAYKEFTLFMVPVSFNPSVEEEFQVALPFDIEKTRILKYLAKKERVKLKKAQYEIKYKRNFKNISDLIFKDKIINYAE